jgi:hypothetical protein
MAPRKTNLKKKQTEVSKQPKNSKKTDTSPVLNSDTVAHAGEVQPKSRKSSQNHTFLSSDLFENQASELTRNKRGSKGYKPTRKSKNPNPPSSEEDDLAESDQKSSFPSVPACSAPEVIMSEINPGNIPVQTDDILCSAQSQNDKFDDSDLSSSLSHAPACPTISEVIISEINPVDVPATVDGISISEIKPVDVPATVDGICISEIKPVDVPATVDGIFISEINPVDVPATVDGISCYVLPNEKSEIESSPAPIYLNSAEKSYLNPVDIPVPTDDFDCPSIDSNSEPQLKVSETILKNFSTAPAPQAAAEADCEIKKAHASVNWSNAQTAEIDSKINPGPHSIVDHETRIPSNHPKRRRNHKCNCFSFLRVFKFW